MRATCQRNDKVHVQRVCLQWGVFATKLHQKSVFTVGNICDEIASGSKLK